MKKKSVLSSIAIMLFYTINGFNQTITLISNPSKAPYKYSYWGFNGTSVVYKNNLFIQYCFGPNIFQLAQFDGEKLTLIPNPDKITDHFDGGPGALFIFKNELYWQYANATCNYQFIKYDGNSYIIYPNPDEICSSMYSGVGGSIVEYDNYLFFPYINCQANNAHSQLAKFDGTAIKLFSNPTKLPCTWPESEGIIYKNELYWRFLIDCKHYYLTKFVSDSIILLPFPDASLNIGSNDFAGNMIVFNNELLCDIYDSSGKYKIAKINGDSFSLIGDNNNGSYFIYNTKIFKDNLFLLNIDSLSNYHLVKYDGYSLKQIPDPLPSSHITSRSCIDNFILYDDNLFFRYQNDSGIFQLGKYNGLEISLISNPDISYNVYNAGVVGSPIVYNNCLYWAYRNKYNIVQLSQYNGKSYTLIDNPDSSTVGYVGNPTVFRNNLYLQYLDKDYCYRLARLDGITSIPDDISIESFNIFPNPATDQITIQNFLNKTDCNITLYNISGSQIFKKIMKTNEMILNINYLPSGIYFLQITGENIEEIKKVIKK
jgi:hypothetical protein